MRGDFTADLLIVRVYSSSSNFWKFLKIPPGFWKFLEDFRNYGFLKSPPDFLKLPQIFKNFLIFKILQVFLKAPFGSLKISWAFENSLGFLKSLRDFWNFPKDSKNSRDSSKFPRIFENSIFEKVLHSKFPWIFENFLWIQKMS